jgi:hypothetical protein
MFNKIRNRISPASLLAMVALFTALGGTGYAAVKIDGKDLKNKSVAGKKLKNKTITGGKVKSNTLGGTQINEAKLGTVPGAVNATNAVNAANAANVSGRQRTFKKVAATSAAGAPAAIAAAPEVELFKAGPLTVYGKCATDTAGPTTYAVVFVKTSQDGATLNSSVAQLYGSPAFLTTGTPELGRIAVIATAGANTAVGAPWITTEFSAIAPNGSSFGAQVTAVAKNGNLPAGNGVYGAGDVCLFPGQMNQFS